jgi:hypothetical protein
MFVLHAKLISAKWTIYFFILNTSIMDLPFADTLGLAVELVLASELFVDSSKLALVSVLVVEFELASEMLVYTLVLAVDTSELVVDTLVEEIQMVCASD